MREMNDYEARRLENIKRNKALLQSLDIRRVAPSPPKPPQRQKRKLEQPAAVPSRTSARLASVGSRPSYNEDELGRSRTAADAIAPQRGLKRKHKPASQANGLAAQNAAAEHEPRPTPPLADIAVLRAQWAHWTPAAPPPTRDALTGAFHFATHPHFTPNKSPEEVLREGAFGGSYFRPLWSAALRAHVADDWRELPASWTAGLAVGRYLTAPAYDAGVNKFGVACGLSIEEWEANGWIAHAFDVRGWFQWYCRFWLGRRCQDDERQVARWRRCVGDTGRWRRALLKRYVALGVRTVWDDGEEGEDAPEVSPVMHQTCHHWAFEVRQGVLDEYWRTGR